MKISENIEPKQVMRYFEDICAIPHGSTDTKAICDYCESFAKKHGFQYYRDLMNNIIIACPASPGYESSPAVILQGHLDMVCEKDPGYDFDFSNREVFQRQYKQFFGNTAVRSYDNIKEFFEVDLEILEKFLIHASIPAIRLEKPFVAREVQSINRLLDGIESKEFTDLINDNADKLLPGTFETIAMDIENLSANRAAVEEVENILKTLNIE